MTIYILRRLLLMIPTLFGIMVLNFVIIQAAPGGPVEQAIAKLKGVNVDATSRFSGGGDVTLGGNRNLSSSSEGSSGYRGAQGIEPELIARLEKEYGFDKPLWERFWQMMGRYARFDFGQSFYRDNSVVSLVMEKLPVSISLGIWTTLLTYLIAIPLGIRKAVRDGSHFDVWSSAAIIIGYAIPSFLFAILLIVLFAGGGYVQWFPLRGLISENWEMLPWPQKILDYAWHMVLPVTAMMVGSFASLTMLTKNSFLEEIRKTYVLTARAKGVSEQRVLYGHVFRNAMLIVIAGFPGALVRMLFTGALLIEVIFSLDGMGLLGFESAVNRDYPVMFGTLYVFTLLGLVLGILGDLMYVAIDPRIDFEGRAA